jgi:hypothetical protein
VKFLASIAMVVMTSAAIAQLSPEPKAAVEPRDGSNSPNATWKFTRWDLVDLSHFKVKLKAEFQGSNRDMYRPEAIVATSAK